VNKKTCFIALILFGAAANFGRADVIYLKGQSAERVGKSQMTGVITAADTLRVEFNESISKQIKQVPVNEILFIDYTGDLPVMKTVRQRAAVGQYADALDKLEKNTATAERSEVNQDIAYYKAFCVAKLALAGTEVTLDEKKLGVTEAGGMMLAFLKDNPTSYHYFEATEIIGDLLVAKKLYAKAEEYYGKLEKAPWPDYKMRAGVAIGRSLLHQGKLQEATAAFDKVMATEAEGSLPQIQRMAAYLGKAEVMLASKKPADAIKLIDTFLQKALGEDSPLQSGSKSNVENSPLLAKAYNILGTAERQAGHAKAAVLAFLHVDLLYSGVPDAHAESLANLADLWGELRRIDRADEARRVLKEKYPNSPWCKEGR